VWVQYSMDIELIYLWANRRGDSAIGSFPVELVS
jgi:hypothetical protein